MFPSNASTFCRRIPTTFSSANYLKINSVAATLIRLQPSSLPHQQQQFGNVRRMGGVGGGAGFMEQYVYDITEFVESHPGGDKILLAAGGSIVSSKDGKI
jgi:hypothetical protein